MNYREIVWIAAYPKSGSTWLRLFLDAYLLQDEVNINDILSSCADDNSKWHAIGDGETDVRKLPVDVQGLARPMALLRLVLAFQNNQHADVPLFVKTHNAHILANGIELLPECLTKAVVCLVRDPRDVLISYAKHMGLGLDEAITTMADKHRVLTASDKYAKTADIISSWPKNVSSYLQADTHNVKVFKYEDLKKDPVSVFADMLAHAGIHPDIDRVKKAVELTEISKLRIKEKQDGFGESSPHAKNQFFGKGEVGGWKDKLTPLQQRRIEKFCGQVMKKLGYLTKIRRIA